MPRNDDLYNIDNEKIKRIRTKLDIPEGKKVILYAPTWRNSEDGGKSYSLKPPIDISFWKKNLAEEYVILFRIHYVTTQLLGIKFDEFIKNVTEYPDINDLMIAADILISDYSATIFDYAILERPIISFAYDYEDYRNNRGLYLDLEKNLPDGIVKTQEELILKLKSFNYKEQCLKTKIFKNKFIEQGGNATEMCVKALFDN
jgi:CDP-glycerol glycerophosphotransferase